MRLYATLTSERDSRPAKKGGDKVLRTKINIGNKEVAEVVVVHNEGSKLPTLTVYYKGKNDIKVHTVDTDDLPY
jgi:hypothetical protein